jgi:hypothetical protein
MAPEHSTLSSLDRLENEANDDFLLLSELGPDFFGSEHLLELKQTTTEKIELFEKRLRLAMLLGGTGVAWAFLAFLAHAFQKPLLSIAAYVLAAVSFAIFFGMLLWQKREFESRGELEYNLQVIDEELRKRATQKIV